jgi:hypothetical protein
MDREPAAEVIADEVPGQLVKEQPPLTDLALLFGLHCTRRAIPAGFRIEHGTTTGRRDHLLRSKQTNSGMGRLKPDVLVLRSDRAAAVIDAKYKRLAFSRERPSGVDQADLYQLAAYASR